jgi:hypothetical protein
MGSERVTRVLCVADPGGSLEALDALLDQTDDVQAVVLVGELGGGTDSLRALFKSLKRGGLPSYWVPGPGDAPIADYLHEASGDCTARWHSRPAATCFSPASAAR